MSGLLGKIFIVMRFSPLNYLAAEYSVLPIAVSQQNNIHFV